MKRRSILTVIAVGLISLVVFAGCGSSGSSATGTLVLSITDAPAADNFSAVNVTISEVRISREAGENTSDWITLSTTPQTINLLALSGGMLQELGVKDLAPGQYNQIRLIVTEGNVVVDGQTYPLQINSGTVKLVNPFIIQEGITTELIVDFNVAHSVIKNGPPLNPQYHLTPVTRLAYKATSGAISGAVVLDPASPGTLITVSTVDADGNPISTVCKSDGTFVLGYLPAGTYNLTIEAAGYNTDTSLTGITVAAGETTPVGTVTLTKAQ